VFKCIFNLRPRAGQYATGPERYLDPALRTTSIALQPQCFSNKRPW